MKKMSIEISEERFTCYDDNELLDSIEEGKGFFEGLIEKPPTLEEALYDLGITDHNLPDDKVSKAKRLVKKAKRITEIKSVNLTDDETRAITWYTLQLGKRSLYKIINESISLSRDRENLRKASKFIYLFLSGLRKLPRLQQPQVNELYRGIKTRVPTSETEACGHQCYEDGRSVTWWGFTSTSRSIEKAKKIHKQKSREDAVYY